MMTKKEIHVEWFRDQKQIPDRLAKTRAFTGDLRESAFINED